jgi:tripartite-type tricarboxylate transporter receptor subunit TctC
MTASPGAAQSLVDKLGRGYPDEPIRIVTSALGGSADLVARVLARELTLSLGQPVTVDNRANAVIPMTVVADARADGCSLLVSGGALWIGPLLQETPSRNVFTDFAPITLATSAPNILVVHPSLPVNSVTDLIALAESRPGELLYSSGSTGSSSHLAGESFKLMTGVDIVRARYNESGAIIDDLISGRVQLMFGTAAVVAPYLGSDRLRAIAVTSARPSMLAPGLPTVAASGFPGFESATLIGLFAPAQTPAAIIDILNRESVRILCSPDIKNEFLSAAMDTVGSSPEEFADIIKSEMARLGKVIGQISG